MQYLEVSGAVVLYIGRTVSKGLNSYKLLTRSVSSHIQPPQKVTRTLSCLGGHGFESIPTSQLPWLKFLVVLLSQANAMAILMP
jgi:hypothetical protein